jgi:transposase
MLLRFAAGRPVSGVTCAFLAWIAERMAADGVRVLALVWDNAPWHVSREVRAWIRDHNRRVEAAGTGCRLIVCRLPSKSPWLNPIEPRWAHARQAGRGRARAQAHRRRADPAAAHPLPLPAPPPARTTGRLNLH